MLEYLPKNWLGFSEFMIRLVITRDSLSLLTGGKLGQASSSNSIKPRKKCLLKGYAVVMNHTAYSLYPVFYVAYELEIKSLKNERPLSRQVIL